MACLQSAFLRLPAHPLHHRATLLHELATTQIRSTGGRRYRRVFGVPLSVPRPHLIPRVGGGDSSSASSATALAASAAPENGGRSIVHVTACTALLCLLLQVRVFEIGIFLFIAICVPCLYPCLCVHHRVLRACLLTRREWLRMEPLRLSQHLSQLQ
jgi:hypothetical protein